MNDKSDASMRTPTSFVAVAALVVSLSAAIGVLYCVGRVNSFADETRTKKVTIINDAGFPAAIMDSDSKGDGRIETFGRLGERRCAIATGNNNLGMISIYHVLGDPLITLGATAADSPSGGIWINGPENKLLLRLAGLQNGDAGTIRVFGGGDTMIIEMTERPEGHGIISVQSKEGHPILQTGGDSSGRGMLQVIDENFQVLFDVMGTSDHTGAACAYGPYGRPVLCLTSNTESQGEFWEASGEVSWVFGYEDVSSNGAPNRGRE